MKHGPFFPSVLAFSMLTFLATTTSATVTLQVEATSPHVANGLDASTVTVVVTDDGAPVTDADVALDVSPPVFVNQLAHAVLHLSAHHVGNGRYVTSFPSLLPGPFAVVATDRVSLADAVTFVEFVPVTAETVSAPFPGDVAAAPDLKDDCARFFDTLDEEFYPPRLTERIAAETDAAKKAALEQRVADLRVALRVIQGEIDLETISARGGTPTQAQNDAQQRMRQDAKDAIKRLSDKQEELLKQFFSDPFDPAKFQQCTELFNNFKLVADFATATMRIARAKELGQKVANGTATPAERAEFQDLIKNKIATRGPDASIAHIRWAKFAHIAIDLDVSKSLWQSLKPILAKGSTITVRVLSDNDPTTPGIQPAMQSDATLQTIRQIFDPLTPKDTDTDAEKDRKINEVEKKLVELIKTIVVDRAVIAQLPMLDGTKTLMTSLTSAQCVGGDVALLHTVTTSAVTLSADAGVLFGFGVDNSGKTYVVSGEVTGSQATLALAGFGLNPVLGAALNAFTGSVVGDTIFGAFSGYGVGLAGQPDAACTWEGTFTVAPRLQCDLDGDGDVDRDDVAVIFGSRGIRTVPGDPRDADGDGVITVNDARVCTLACTRPHCAP